MSATSARQSQRVPIDAPVRLTLRALESSPEEERTLPGRALDLSEGGMRVATDTTLAVGEEVTCSLELDEVRASLRGRVRWSKPVAAASLGRIGLGIEWSALDDTDSGLLRRWLASNSQRGELVLLHIPSLLEPLRARGCVTGDALQLVAALPQLAPGVEVEFQLGEYGSRRVGRIERVELQKRAAGAAPELALQLLPSGSARSRRQLVYGLAESEVQPLLPPPDLRGASFAAAARQLGSGAARERHDSLEDTRRMRRRSSSGATLARRSGNERAKWRDLVRGALRRGGHDDPRPRRTTLQDPRSRQHTTEEFQAPRTRLETLAIPTLNSARLMRSAIWLLTGISVVVLIWALRDASRDQQPRDAWVVQPKQGPAKAAPKPAAPRTVEPSVAAGALPVASAPVAAPAREEPAALDDSTEGSPSQPRTVAVQAAPVAATPTPTGTKSSGVPAHLPSASVSTVGRRNEIFLPLIGSVQDVRVTLWREPAALVIDMPSARVASPTAIRSLRGGGIRKVRLDEARSTPQLQLFLSSSSARFVTKTVPNGLVIVLEYDLRAMP